MDGSSRQEPSSNWIIGVGASAGGLEALTAFVNNLPENFPFSIIIAQHLAPHVKSMMVDLLARQSKLPVKAAADGGTISPGTIYVVPPNSNISVSENKIYLSVAPPDKRAKPSVDEFFYSLSRIQGARIAGIILSGTGTDGAEGIRAIHTVGGLTLAQDGFSAKYDGMPQAAIDTSCIDEILAPQEMAKNLVQLLQRHLAKDREQDILQTKEWRECLTLLKKQSGVDYSQYRPSTIRRRVLRRMQTVHAVNIKDYLDYLRKTPGEIGLLSQDLLVSVTQFFRDPEVFESFRQQLAELIVKKKNGEEFRFWVAGCATGEEAYSIAILLTELQERLRKNLVVKVFATDLDQEAILEARQARYDESLLKNVSKEHLQKYFESRGDHDFEVVRRIRDIVIFSRHDMIQSPPFVKLDGMSCRNVLIYFEPELQNQVLEIFHYALVPGGMMLLGKSESLGKSSTLFDIVDKKNKIFRRLDVPSTLQVSRLSVGGIADFVPPKIRPDRGMPLLEQGLMQLLKHYGHCGVIIDRDYHIVQVVGDISPYASFSASPSDLRLLSLLEKDASVELPIVVRKTLQNLEGHHTRWYRKKNHGRILQYRMRVQPLVQQNATPNMTPLLLLSFESRKEKDKVQATSPLHSDDVPARILELEQELAVTKEHLQTVIEELGVANEELQALNEELSSTNEELQSSNEELETANEELQSGNEELSTVNDELGVKSQQLREMNLSLENIQESLGAGLVVVDQKCQVLRYNQKALEIFALTPADIGKDIFRISARCELADFENRLHEIVRTGQPFDSSCEGLQTVYQLQGRPFFNEDGEIVGAILVFYDNTQMVRTRERLELSEMQTRSIIEGFTSPISLKDQYGRYQMVNTAFLDFFKLKPEQVKNKTDRDLFGREQSTQLRESDLDVMFREESVKQVEPWKNSEGEIRQFFVNRFPLFNKTQERPYAVGMIAADITSEISTQKKLRESDSRYRAIIEDQAVLVCRQLPSGELTFTNSVFDVQFGETSGSAIGRYLYEYFSFQDQERAKNDIRGLTARYPVSQAEYRVFKRDGTFRWIRWVYRGIFDEDGTLLEIQSVGFDVTDYVTKADRLLEQEAVFSEILGNTSDIVLIFAKRDGDYFVEYMNRTAEMTLESYKGQVMGKSLKQIRDPERARILTSYYDEALRKNETVTYENTLVINNELRYMSQIAVPLRSSRQGESPDRVSVISKDITALKMTERDLRVAKEAAEVANQAKSDFLASMSHELRTPLNVVLGMATLLSETALSEEQKSFVGSIDRSGKSLLSLIEDVLDISKIESGKITLSAENFQLGDLVRDVVTMFAFQAQKKGLAIQYTIDKEADIFVSGDSGRLRQILVNLIGNAIKFTDKGIIQVRVTADKHSSAGEKGFRFEVQDSGIGIKALDSGKIFKRFSQVESGHARRFGGSGLGLVISREIAQLMKGDMGFESEEGQGSTFWFTVKLIQSTETAVKASEQRTKYIEKKESQLTQPMRVLAIDDNKESLNIIRLFLQRLGHTPFTASSGFEAMEIVRDKKVDLVLMDVQMPEMDGYETTKRLRQEMKTRMPILALTANAMSGDVDKCLEAGMNDYLSKPVRMDVLKEMLTKWSLRLKE